MAFVEVGTNAPVNVQDLREECDRHAQHTDSGNRECASVPRPYKLASMVQDRISTALHRARSKVAGWTTCLRCILRDPGPSLVFVSITYQLQLHCEHGASDVTAMWKLYVLIITATSFDLHRLDPGGLHC